MDTGDTVTDGEDTAGLSEVGLLLDTADALLEDGRNLSGGGLGVGGIGSCLEGDRSGLEKSVLGSAGELVRTSATVHQPPNVPATLHLSRIGAGAWPLELRRMDRWNSGAIGAVFDGLTAANLVAETAAARRDAMRVALENIFVISRELWLTRQPIDVDGWREGG